MDGRLSFRSFFGILVLLLGILLIGFNYWHVMQCTKSYNFHIDEEIPKLERRVLEAESKMLQNDIFLQKFIHELYLELLNQDKLEMEKLFQNSRDEAIKVALDLTKLSSTNKPKIYQFDEKYKNIHSLANLIDDMFVAESSKTEPPYNNEQDHYNGWKFREGFDDFNEFAENNQELREEEEEFEEEYETEKERIESCQGWKSHYNVIEGVSWGNLPFDLQKKWKSYNCDVFLGMK